MNCITLAGTHAARAMEIHQRLTTLGTKLLEVASAIAQFPHILSHSVEEKLCPLLEFFEALGIPQKQLGKMILLNPRFISYSIEAKLSEIVNFLANLGRAGSSDGGNELSGSAESGVVKPQSLELGDDFASEDLKWQPQSLKLGEAYVVEDIVAAPPILGVAGALDLTLIAAVVPPLGA